MKLKRSGTILGIVLVSGIMIIPTGFPSKVYAAIENLIMVKDDVTNNFAGGVDITVDEGNFEDKENWDGKECEKIVTIPNKGNTEALIRVAIVPRWIDENGNPWAGDISSNVVEIGYKNIGINSDWRDGEDGYYYYSKILDPDNSTSEIMENVKLNIQNIEEGLRNSYKGKTLVIDIKAEAVEASEEAYKATWSPIKNSAIDSMLTNLVKQ